ncbi:YhgE/Pip family protein [Homoserinimonas sp. A520]
MSARTTAGRRWLRPAAIGAVILVPLAFAGLFVGAIANSDDTAGNIPAALVNQDELIYQTAADGSEIPIFAGRQLVTELIADDSFDWTISNSDDAEQALIDGKVHAILTIPSDFSASILSLSGDSPKKAVLGIRTDDAHSYLTGVLSESVGTGMADAFGTEITAQYIGGITSGMGELGFALGEAADGAGQLSEGAAGLSGGLSELANGAASAGAGATDFAAGVSKYTGGVDQLAGGLGTLRDGTSGLDQLSAGVRSYTSGVKQLSDGIAGQVVAATASIDAILSADPTNQEALDARAALGTLGFLSGELSTTAASGPPLAQQVSGGIDGVQSGISQSASAAAQLAGGSAGLRSGAASIASGVGGLAIGADSAAAGADQLATGAGELATGLESGAAQVPAMDDGQREASAKLAADPVGVDVTRDNEVAETTQALAAFLVPLGLWIGALAIFLIERRLSARVLASTARSGRLLLDTLRRTSLIALAQAAVLVALLHFGLGVAWSLLPATLAFAAITAVAFTAFHHLLVSVLGRAGLVISLFAIAVQVTATGGLYPIELLSAPFQWVSPLLPLTYAVDGMQAIIAAGGVAPVLGAGLALAAFGTISALLALVAIRRGRRTTAMQLATA